MLAPRSSQSLVSSSGHANTGRFFPSWRRLCWRLAPREALFLRPPTPTGSRFSRADGAFVGALLPETPCFSVRQRQQGPVFPKLAAPMLAPRPSGIFVSPSANANRVRISSGCRRLCWRLAPGHCLRRQPREQKSLRPISNLRLTMRKSMLGWASRADSCGESAACQPAAT